MKVSNKYLIFKEGGGRMGNQWMNMAHFLAFTLENGSKFKLINLKFWYFTKYFSSGYKNRLYIFPSENDLFGKIVNTYLLVLDLFPRVIFRHVSSLLVKILFKFNSSFKNAEKEVLNPHSTAMVLDEELSDKLIKGSIVLEGWGFRNWELLEKHALAIRNLISPNLEQVKIVERELASIRDKYKLMIGVFVRQTDYKTWHNGDFFFSVGQYVQWMKLFAEKKGLKHDEIAFVIVTDEQDLVSELREMANNYFVFHGHTIYYYLRNIIRLSQCDCILSPPSTFSTLSAFVGQKPIIPLYSQNLRLEKDDIIVNSFFDARLHPVFSIAVN